MPSDDRFTEENKRSFVKYARVKTPKFAEHYSRQAPGTPVTWETLFQLIKDNKTDTVPFKWMRRLLHKYDDEFIWRAYAMWLTGDVYEAIFPIDAITIDK